MVERVVFFRGAFGYTPEKIWEKGWLPVVIVLHESIDTQEVRAAFEYACDFFNDELGFPLLVGPTDGDDLWFTRAQMTYVNVKTYPKVLTEAESTHGLAFTRLVTDEDSIFIKRAEIYLSEEFFQKTQHIQYRIAAHEVGHLVGLDHDQAKWSVMYGRAIDTPFELKGNDKEYLKEKYQ